MVYQVGSFNDIWTMFMAVYFNWMFLSTVDFLCGCGLVPGN